MGRPRLKDPSPATLRKRRQMERRRQEERGLLLLTPSKDTMNKLGEVVKLTGGTAKGEAESILRRAVLAALAEAQQMSARFGPIYLRAQAYMKYARYLEVPGSFFRVGNRVLKEADWRPLSKEIGSFYDAMKRRGWSHRRVTVFLERAAERAAGKSTAPASESPAQPS